MNEIEFLNKKNKRGRKRARSSGFVPGCCADTVDVHFASKNEYAIMDGQKKKNTLWADYERCESMAGPLNRQHRQADGVGRLKCRNNLLHPKRFTSTPTDTIQRTEI